VSDRLSRPRASKHLIREEILLQEEEEVILIILNLKKNDVHTQINHLFKKRAIFHKELLILISR